MEYTFQNWKYWKSSLLNDKNFFEFLTLHLNKHISIF